MFKIALGLVFLMLAVILSNIEHGSYGDMNCMGFPDVRVMVCIDGGENPLFARYLKCPFTGCV